MRKQDKQTRDRAYSTDLCIEEAEEKGHEEALEGVEEHLHVDLEEVGGWADAVRQPDEAHVVHSEQRDQDQRGFGQLPVGKTNQTKP